MRTLDLCWLALVLGILACDTAGKERGAGRYAAPPPVGPLPAVAPAGEPARAGSAKEAQTKQSPPADRAQGGYGLLGVLDPQFDNMVAFALKVPRSWHAKQSFTRRWKGALPQNQIYLSLRAPDGQTQIEYLPSSEYSYSSGPLTDNLRAQARSLGLPEKRMDDELAPMKPVAYIQQVLLPKLARDGLVLRDPQNPLEAPPQRREGQKIESRGSLDGTLANGNRARIECRVHVQTQQLNSETYYGWSVVPSITQTSGDLTAAHAHTLIAQESIVQNPAWMEQNRALQNQGQ